MPWFLLLPGSFLFLFAFVLCFRSRAILPILLFTKALDFLTKFCKLLFVPHLIFLHFIFLAAIAQFPARFLQPFAPLAGACFGVTESFCGRPESGSCCALGASLEAAAPPNCASVEMQTARLKTIMMSQ